MRPCADFSFAAAHPPPADVGLSHASAAAESDLYPGETSVDYTKKALAGLHQRAGALLPSVIPPMMAQLPADKQQGVQALLQGVC